MEFTFDALRYSYPSRRNLVYAKKGMVATSNPLAAQAGLAILKQGGNAIDAAVATAAALTVTEPTSNGLGSDAFALVFTEGKLYGLNASGPAPMAASVAALKAKGYPTMPQVGLHTVNVPGAVSAWVTLAERFGKKSLSALLQPAISYAEEGYALQPTVSREWQREYEKFSKLRQTDAIYQHWFDVFTDGGRLYRAGDTVRLPLHAKTLREIGESRGESFYRGEIAERIDAFFRENGGFLRKEDLACYHPEWVQPLTVSYHGYDVWELPPNGHGITVLMALQILKGMELGGCDTFESTHRQIEALKLAFSDAQTYVTDPRYMQVSVQELLSEAYAEERRSLITDRAILPVCGKPKAGGTVYLCTADAYGNMVSMIQSNYMGFGSGMVIPGTGIALHNRGSNFTMDEGHDNCIAPGKKPYHTIIPGFLTKDGKAAGAFGIMGGFMQPQAHLQVLVDLLEYGMNPQEALDRPRWMWTGGRKVSLEQSFDQRLANELLRAGHEIEVQAESIDFGRGEIILRDDNGTLCGACEPRTDSMVAVW